MNMPENPNPSSSEGGRRPDRKPRPPRHQADQSRPSGQPDPQRNRPPRRRDSRKGRPNSRTPPIPGRDFALSAIAIPFLTVIAATAFCYFARPILLPLVLAGTLAYVLAPGVTFLTDHKVPRVLSVFMVLSLAMGIIGVVGFVAIDQAQGLARALPSYWSALQSWLGDMGDWRDQLHPMIQGMLPPPETDIWSQIELTDFSAIPQTLFTGIGSVLSFLVWSVIVGFLTLFMLLDMPGMYSRMLRMMGPRYELEIKNTLAHIHDQLRLFLMAKLATSAGLGIVATIGLLLLDVPYAWVWGPLVGMLNIIPYVGGILSAIPPIIMVMIAEQAVMPGVYVLVFIVLLQQLEGSIITPKLIGDRVKLNVVAVLVATLCWGWLWGAIGILLAIPITAAIKVVCERIEPLRPIAVLLG